MRYDEPRLVWTRLTTQISVRDARQPQQCEAMRNLEFECAPACLVQHNPAVELLL
jgi:hypothetical protein